METATRTVEQMSEGFAQPDAQDAFTQWAERSIAHSNKEAKERERGRGPREISLKDRPEDERDFINAVAVKDESAKESRRGASVRSEQRSDRESTTSHVAPKEPSKLVGAELDNRWRQVSAGRNAQWQKAHPTFQAELVKALGAVDNQEEVMQHLAAHPEEVSHVKDAEALQAAIHQIAVQESMNTEVKQATVRHPNAAEKIRSATTQILADRTPPFIKAFVNESEVIGELLYTLADQATLNKLLETATTNPGKALRVLHDMERDIHNALSSEKAPESRARPRAPKPPSEVGGRGAAGDDGTRGAEDFGDFSMRQSQRYWRHA